MKAKIRIKNVSKIFEAEGRKCEALRNVDLDAYENEFLCIMGPSGCGKTTLLNLIAGFVPITTGAITMDGRTVSQPGSDRAVVFQSDAVFPWMTVEQNICYNARVTGKSKSEQEEITERFLDLVDLKGFRKAWPKELSGGMRKRVDLARAYSSNPEVLLMDEPFGALDIMTKEKLQVELLRIWDQDPRTVVFITHDLEEGLFLGDRLILMTSRPGKIVQVFKIPFSRPRNLSLKTTEEFVSLRRDIRKHSHNLFE